MTLELKISLKIFGGLASVEKLKKKRINKVYPGHGDVFSWKMLFKEEN